MSAANGHAPARWYPILNGALLVGLAGSALLLYSLEVTPQRTVRVPWADFELPQTCQFVLQAGAPCTACGVTRALVAAAHGDFAAARVYHFAGPAIWLMLLSQIVLRLAFLRPAFRRPVIDLALSVAMLLAFAVLLN